jgi:hypothetical protein
MKVAEKINADESRQLLRKCVAEFEEENSRLRGTAAKL